MGFAGWWVGARRIRVAAGIAALAAGMASAQCGTAPTQPTDPPPSSPPTTPVPPVIPVPDPVPSPAGPEIFVGVGDIALCGAGQQALTARLLDTIGGTVFTLGDNAYPNGSRENFRDCYDPTWGRHTGRTRPAPGNHDYYTPGGSGYYQYFGANAGPSGRGYYSFKLGAWHIISLNSADETGASSTPGSPQGTWLKADLAANAAKCTLAYWHHPVFTSGQNGDNKYMREFYRILVEARAELILNGHDHLYERFAPQDADGRADPAGGIRQFVVGTGGVPLYRFVTVKPNSEVRINNAFGVLKLTLSADAYQWDFVTPDGIRDSGTGTCR